VGNLSSCLGAQSGWVWRGFGVALAELDYTDSEGLLGFGVGFGWLWAKSKSLILNHLLALALALLILKDFLALAKPSG